MKKNLEQLRAAHAYEEAQKNIFHRNDVNNLPALVLSCGLLATSAYVSVSGQSSREGMWNAMDAVARHLRDPELGPILTMPSHQNQFNETKVMLCELSQRESGVLIRATAEALAFLSYLKRFASLPPQ